MVYGPSRKVGHAENTDNPVKPGFLTSDPERFTVDGRGRVKAGNGIPEEVRLDIERWIGTL